jgi:hypothetical protein
MPLRGLVARADHHVVGQVEQVFCRCVFVNKRGFGALHQECSAQHRIPLEGFQEASDIVLGEDQAVSGR